jgi:hypothetical protein
MNISPSHFTLESESMYRLMSGTHSHISTDCNSVMELTVLVSYSSVKLNSLPVYEADTSLADAEIKSLSLRLV